MLNLRKRVVTSLLLIPGMNLIHLMGKMHILSLNFEFQFNSDEWKTTISVPTGENPLLSYEINWLVFGYLSLLKNWYHVRCIRHLRKKSCDYISYDLKTIAMLWNISSGKVPFVLHYEFPVFLRMSRKDKRAKFNLCFDFLVFFNKLNKSWQNSIKYFHYMESSIDLMC